MDQNFNFTARQLVLRVSAFKQHIRQAYVQLLNHFFITLLEIKCLFTVASLNARCLEIGLKLVKYLGRVLMAVMVILPKRTFGFPFPLALLHAQF